MTEWFRRIKLGNFGRESVDLNNAQELLAKLGRLMEPTEGSEQAVFSISQEDLIWAALSAGCDAEPWLKTPAGWPEMRVKVRRLGDVTKVKVLNLGADSGIVHERSGFSTTIQEPTDMKEPISFSYIPDNFYSLHENLDYTNPYWARVKSFIDGLDRRGKRFVEEIDLRPPRQKIEFVSTVIAKAFQCPLPQT